MNNRLHRLLHYRHPTSSHQEQKWRDYGIDNSQFAPPRRTWLGEAQFQTLFYLRYRTGCSLTLADLLTKGLA